MIKDNMILDNWLCLLLDLSDESSNFPDEARIGIIAALRNQIILFSFVNDTSICHKIAGIYNYKLFFLEAFSSTDPKIGNQINVRFLFLLQFNAAYGACC